MIAPTSGEIPSAQGLVDGLKKTPADIAIIVPSIVQELSQSPELLDYCAKNLEMIMYCGGDLPQSVGDLVALKIRLVNQFGASELGLVALLQSNSHRDPTDWKYVEFHPDTGAQFRHVIDDIHELCIVRHPRLEQQQPSFTFFPELQEYPTRDLFVRHPATDKENLWRWVARADDVIVFLNGEKTNPISMEQHIVSRHPEIAAVLVAGAQRFQASLLIELVANEKGVSSKDRVEIVEKIWPIIEEANQECPAHARIAKSHTLLTDPQKPMLRAGKGTIQRAGTLELYEHELDSLYANADVVPQRTNGHVSGLPVLNIDNVSRIIREAVSSVTDRNKLDDMENFFTLGMDSFQALILLRKLKQEFIMSDISLSTIYGNPSVSALSGAIVSLSEQHKVSQKYRKKVHQQRSIIKEYQGMINLLPTAQTVILTGSTGALGSYILNALRANPAISHIYCLNRATDGLSLQTERNQARGLSTNLSSSRVTFLTADLSQKHLGLESETYDGLLATVTLVIHNAWPVNFNLSLASFRPHLTGVVNLIEFTNLGKTSPHLFFVSSVSSVLLHHKESFESYEESLDWEIPEEIIIDDDAPGVNGYSESKYISELILDHAARNLSIDISIARVGQIAGAVEYAGLWNKAEWFPSLVISSVHVGAIPDSLGSILDSVDWVPIDLLAEILVELALFKDKKEKFVDRRKNSYKKPRVFHPLHRDPTGWGSIKRTLIDALSSITGKNIETVSPAVWLSKIRQEVDAPAGDTHQPQDGDLEELVRVNPAVKLLPFYEDMLMLDYSIRNYNDDQIKFRNRFENWKSHKSSAKLRALPEIRKEWIWKWVREWME